jgi:hypothetical protein
MTRLLCLIVAGGLLWPGTPPARAAEGCDDLAELWQAALRPPVDEVTREKIESLLNDAEGMCAEGKTEDLDVKLRNVRELLESDIEALPDPQPGIEVDPRQQG